VNATCLSAGRDRSRVARRPKRRKSLNRTKGVRVVSNGTVPSCLPSPRASASPRCWRPFVSDGMRTVFSPLRHRCSLVWSLAKVEAAPFLISQCHQSAGLASHSSVLESAKGLRLIPPRPKPHRGTVCLRVVSHRRDAEIGTFAETGRLTNVGDFTESQLERGFVGNVFSSSSIGAR
jgi:hypothetical protein